MNKPKTQKPKVTKESTDFFDPGFELRKFSVDSDLLKELSEKGLEARWVNAKHIAQNGGTHPKGWVPYKRDKKGDSQSFLHGSDPDGFIKRGDLILATKTKEMAERHRQYLRHEAKINSVEYLTRAHKRQMRDYLKDSKLSDSMSVVEGYE